MLKQGQVWSGMAVRVGGPTGAQMWVMKATNKRVLVGSMGTQDIGARFTGRRFTFAWDGNGYKRQGQYLHAEVAS